MAEISREGIGNFLIGRIRIRPQQAFLPFGAKEAGEGSLAATIPAVSRAIYDAVGVWIDTLPITPEKILKAIDEKNKAEPTSQN